MTSLSHFYRSFSFPEKINRTINQSVENAGVAFVKGANENNEFFEKINK